MKSLIPPLTTVPFKVLLPLFAALSLSGCGVVVIGGAAAGTAGYMSGELTATLEGSYEQVVAAADRAITENSIHQISKTTEKYLTDYTLKTPQGDKVQLHIAYTTKELTSVSIRIGPLGEESLSHQFLNEIESRLNH